MTTSKQSADNKVLRDAMIECVQFDIAIARDLLNQMAGGKADGDKASKAKDAASVAFCQFAADMVDLNMETDGIDRDVITRGFCKRFDSLRPQLAAEGCAFIDTVEKSGKDTTYRWKGHGQNVKSIAKGITEFLHETVTLEDGSKVPAILPQDEWESFTAIKKSVEAARRRDEDDLTRDLREAKEAYREVEAKIRSLVLGQKSAGTIEALTLTLGICADEMADEAESLKAPEVKAPVMESDADAIEDNAAPVMESDADAIEDNAETAQAA